MMTNSDSLLTQAVAYEKAGVLCDYYFDHNLSLMQEEIVGEIAFDRHRRVVICAMTRYGKSMSVADGVSLYIMFHERKKIKIIAPIKDQAAIIRNYIADNISHCARLQELLQFEYTGADRLNKEISKSRITFKNGCELQILSAEGKAGRLMGHGGDLIIEDESCMVPYEVHRIRVSRMLGDSPDSRYVGLGNPFDKLNQFWVNWNDPNFYRIHVNWKTALNEGRTTEAFIEEQRRDLKPREFKILYDADFPDDAEDGLYGSDGIRGLFDRKFGIIKSYMGALKNHKTNPTKETEGIIKRYKRIISADIADMGSDWTVLMWGIEFEGRFEIGYIKAYQKEETMVTAGFIKAMYDSFGADEIHIDCIGIGAGVHSRVSEMLDPNKVKVMKCHFGMAPALGEESKNRHSNRKAEQYFRSAALVEEGMICFTEHETAVILHTIFESDIGKATRTEYKDYSSSLTGELSSMRWKKTSSGKNAIIDPDKSPDFADSFVYFTWKESFADISFGIAGSRATA